MSLCLSAPPYVFGAIYVMTVAWLSDRYKARGIVTAFNCVVAIIGCSIIGYHPDKNVRYFGCFLAIGGAQGKSLPHVAGAFVVTTSHADFEPSFFPIANTPGVAAFNSTNTVTHVKKAVASAVVIGMGGVGGILAGVVFRQQDYPNYR